ncbi:MAG: hypothetical protein P4L45_06475 [Ignavibacteriaceae bacterium]|nr:hypothetical protein [Ignavibacteriaceae bacterium]
MKKKILIILSIVWIVIMSFLGYSLFDASVKQYTKNQVFKEKRLKPSVNFINNYLNTHNRLPSIKEFNQWQTDICNLKKENHINKKIDSLIASNPQWAYEVNCFIDSRSFPQEVIENYDKNYKNNSYVLETWRGEWNEYYISWINLYSTDYSYSEWHRDGIIVMVICIVIGLLPITILLIQKKTNS